MKSVGLIDANILLRSVVGDVPEQAADVGKLLDRIAQGELTGFVPATVIQEFVFVLDRIYKATRLDIAGALSDMIAIPNLVVEHADEILDCLDDYVAHRSISFSDALHCAYAKRHFAGNLVSFDRALARLSGITRIEPGVANQ